MSTSKLLQIILIGLMAVSAILVVLFYAGGIIPETADSIYPEPKFTQPILMWAYILGIIAAIAAIGFPIINMISNPASAKKTLLPLLAIGVVVLIAYVLASDEVLDILGYQGTDNVPGRLKFSGMMIITTYFLAGLAVVSILYSEIANLLK